MNQVGLVGRLTKDPELRIYNEKRPYTVFTIAVDRNFKNSQGIVDADFIRCSAWGRLAENITKYCGKGSIVGINGRLNSRTYVNEQNQKVFTLGVVAEDVRFYQLKSPQSKLDEFELPFEQQTQQPRDYEEFENMDGAEHQSMEADEQEDLEELAIPS